MSDEKEQAEMWLMSLLSHLLTMLLWANVVTSLSFTFSICQVGVQIIPTWHSYYELNETTAQSRAQS